ncbi:hypothetical protein ACHQM5_004186 [Ranunculus cassubicifolius]
MAAAATLPINKIERAHQMYRDGHQEQALEFYTQALSIAKTNPQKISLHSNRAACYLKLHNFKKAAEECTLVLELDQNHTGALMLRAQTLVTLKEYHAALFDVNRLIELNPSSDVYQNLQARLKTQLSLATIPECENESSVSEIEEEEEEEEEEELGEEIEENGIELDEEDEEEIQEQVQPQPQQKAVIAPIDQKAVCPRPVPIHQAPVPKPKGHSRLDYSRWDQVEDDSSEDEDEDEEEESMPQYRFRVRTIGIRPVK